MNKLKYLIVLVLLLLTSCSLTPSDKGVIGDIDINLDNNGGEKEIQGNIMETSKRISQDSVDPYFKDKLSKRAIDVYDEVVESIKNKDNNILLSKVITQRDVEELMISIYMDESQLFHLNNSFGYTSDSSGNVDAIYFEYLYDDREYEDIDKAFSERVNKFKKLGVVSEEEYQKMILDDLRIKSTISKNTARSSSIGSILSSRTDEPNDLAVAKYYQYMMRLRGIESMIVPGEVISEDMFNIIKTSEPQQNTKLKINRGNKGGLNTVELDFGDMYFWNMSKLNDRWYHIDVPYYINSKDLEVNGVKINGEGLKTLINVNDETISSSRIMYKSNPLQGHHPSANSKIFQNSYREGILIEENTLINKEKEMDRILFNITQSGVSVQVLQFENKKTYHEYKKEFQEMIEKHSINNAKSVDNYELLFLDSSLSVIIYNIVYKG